MSAIRLAESESRLVLAADALDADPWLLNVENGTIDLRTGTLREHRREDCITKLVSVCYVAAAEHPVWEAFLDQVTGGDAAVRGFLQRAAGYSLTGATSEEKLFFLHGPSATGKSTFVAAIEAALGDYARTADFDTFIRRRGDQGPRNDIARLEGARVVIANEVEPGKALAPGLVKATTGGDRISARPLYKEAREFRPEFKLWWVANDRPPVSAYDKAIWRRIIQIPFLHVVPKESRDLALKTKLTNDPAIRRAVLAWMVAGCLVWQEHGLAVPDIILDYTAEYRAENDPLHGWIEDQIDLDPGAWTAAADLHKDYLSWASANGQADPVASNQPEWSESLKARGCKGGKQKGDRGWHGIRFRGADG